ncbi:MAG: threonylcarbamoyl-AMP synthase [Rhizobiales bacterium]|nr:threonylcarbamoyl-AMP synthase [Hyphomicrobiales bacterium]
MTIVSQDIDKAAQLLREGKLVAFPTETVYGLGADATDDRAVTRIYVAKERPQFNPLIVHIASIDAAKVLGVFNAAATALANALWPGALTLVVPRTKDCPASLLVSAGMNSIALRVPRHPVAHALLTKVQRPIAAPSANRSGRISPTAPHHVMASLGGRIDMVLDGGTCGIGLESTIISCLAEPPALLRPGGIACETIEDVLEGAMATVNDDGEAPVAPGQLASHYAPRAKVRMGATSVQDGEALLAFGPKLPSHAGEMRNLSERGDLGEAAANLFAMLHELDASGAAGIAVMPIPDTGLGLAINDRLNRASAER